jgi:hypothetical protein
MRALIDGDLFPYECGELRKKAPDNKEEEIAPDVAVGELLPFELCWGAVQSKIDHIVEVTGADEYTVFLSSQDKPTWRFQTATIQPYKGGRHKPKPAYWQLIRDNIQLHYPCKVVEFIEADDAISIEQYADPDNTVICSRDKDLDMIPGNHFKWGIAGRPDEKFVQTKVGGLRCFYKQLLTGDNVDNILGLYGVGKAAACVKRIDKYDTEEEMFGEVATRYIERFGTYAMRFLYENGCLLKMQETLEDRWDRFDDLRNGLEEDRQDG